MARAKRTDRTDARRRHRAQLAGDNGGTADGGDLVVVDADGAPVRGKARTASSASASSPAAPRPARPSFMGAVRGAYHAPNYREDLAILPRLLVHWSVLLSAVLAIVGTGALLAAGASLTGPTPSSSGGTTLAYIGSMLVSLFVGPPPFGAALLIGFMVPRATYLVGLAFGVLAAVCLTILVLAQPAGGVGGMEIQYIAYGWVFGLLGSAFFTAGIAWYKRFLDLLNPNRAQRQRAGQKPVQGRGNAPRNRLSGR